MDRKKCPTAIKRQRQSEQRRCRNRAFKSRLKSALNRLEGSLQSQQAAQIAASLSSVHSLLDKGVKRKILHGNKASRIKSRTQQRAAR